MYENRNTAGDLLEWLEADGVRFPRYRWLLDTIIQEDTNRYNLGQAMQRARELTRKAYTELRDKATAVGFSPDFAFTLGDVATLPFRRLDSESDDVRDKERDEQGRLKHPPREDREEPYLYMMKSFHKKKGALTEKEIAEPNPFVKHEGQGGYKYRIYGNLTDAGVSLMKHQLATIAPYFGVNGYKFAKKGSRWRRDTMVIYCGTENTTVSILDNFRLFQRSLNKGAQNLSPWFVPERPHFTEAVPNCQGISFVNDANAAKRDTSHSGGMSQLLEIAIKYGFISVDKKGLASPLESYAEGIVNRMNEEWLKGRSMNGTPKP